MTPTPFDPTSFQEFRFTTRSLRPDGAVTLGYALGDHAFTERFTIPVPDEGLGPEQLARLPGNAAGQVVAKRVDAHQRRNAQDNAGHEQQQPRPAAAAVAPRHAKQPGGRGGRRRRHQAGNLKIE